MPGRRSLGEAVEAFERIRQIKTIDCFDISHFQSSYLVGSCIRFSNGVPDKNNFRRFKIKTLQTQNDYAALQEIVARRYRNPEEIPDLMMIDGGKGQLSAVQAVCPMQLLLVLQNEKKLFIAIIARRQEIRYS